MADDAHPGEGIRKRFTLDTLGDLDDGLTRRLVDRALEEALEDCDNRPALDKPRRVTLTLEFMPILGQFGGMRGVDAQVAVAVKLPPRAGRAEFLPTSIRGGSVEAYLPDERPQALFSSNSENVEGN